MWIDCLGAWPFGLAGFEVLPFSDIYLGFSGLASNWGKILVPRIFPCKKGLEEVHAAKWIPRVRIEFEWWSPIPCFRRIMSSYVNEPHVYDIINSKEQNKLFVPSAHKSGTTCYGLHHKPISWLHAVPLGDKRLLSSTWLPFYLKVSKEFWLVEYFSVVEIQDRWYYAKICVGPFLEVAHSSD